MFALPARKQGSQLEGSSQVLDVLTESNTHPQTLSQSDTYRFPLVRRSVMLPIPTGLQSLILSRWNNNKYGTSSNQQMEVRNREVIMCNGFYNEHAHAHTHPHSHCLVLVNVRAVSCQWREMSGFGMLFDSSVPPAETPWHLLLFSLSFSHTQTHTWWYQIKMHLHNHMKTCTHLYAISLFILDILMEECGIVAILSCVGDVMAKRRSVFPLFPMATSLSFIGTSTQTYTHT